MRDVKICTGCKQVEVGGEWGALGVEIQITSLELENAQEMVCPDCEGE